MQQHATLFVKESLRLSVARYLCRSLPIIAQYRIGSRIYPFRHGIKDEITVATMTRVGTLFIGKTSDLCGYFMSIYGFFEWQLWVIAQDMCSLGDTIIEVGANVGSETVGYARIVGERGRVFAFEPFPEVRHELERNVSINHLNNVQILPIALGDEEGKTLFVTPEASEHNSGIGYIPEDSLTVDGRGLAVTSAKLDSLTDEIGYARMIIMDVEGSEVRVLRGGEKYIDTHRPIVILEANPKALRRCGYTLVDLTTEIKKTDYTPYIIGHASLQPVNPKTSKQTNWLCIPNEKAELNKRINRLLLRTYLTPFIGRLNPLQRI